MNWIRRLLAWLLWRQTGAVCDVACTFAGASGSVHCITPDVAIRSSDSRARYRVRLALSQSMPDMLARTLHRLSVNPEANIPT